MKLDLYNKRLLAIIGTAVLALVALGLVSMGYFLFEEITRDIRYNQDDEHQNLVVDSAATLPQKVRIVNAGYPELIDSAEGTYIIPLGQLSVDSEEIEEVASVLNSGSYSSGYRFRSETYNNLLVYNEFTGKVEPVYSEKLLITDYEIIMLDSLSLLISEAVITDTDQDGLLSKKDNKVLDVYNLKTKSLDRLYEDGLIYLSNRRSASWSELHLMFYQDINKNNKADKGIDPLVLRKYTPGKGLIPVVPDKILEKIQNTIN